MKSYTQYLQEAKQTWKFKIKTIHQLTDEQSDRIEKHLTKYDSSGLGAEKKTMVQSTPRDFPNHRGYEVYTYEFETNLPVSSHQLKIEIGNMLGLGEGTFKIKGAHEVDIDEDVEQKEVESVLADAEYSEAEKVDSEEFYGDKFNTSFVQELLKLRKDKEKDSE